MRANFSHTRSMPASGTSSKAVTSPPQRADASSSRGVRRSSPLIAASALWECGGGRVQAQHGPSDHPEGALGADEELLEVIPRGVLAQRPQPVPHPTVGQYGLEAQHLLAHVSVTQDVVAARVGGDGSAHGGRAPRPPVGSEQAVLGGRRLLHRLDGGTRLGSDRPAVGVHRQDTRFMRLIDSTIDGLCEPRRSPSPRGVGRGRGIGATRRGGDRAPGHPRVPALGHDGYPGRRARPHHSWRSRRPRPGVPRPGRPR